MAGISFSMDGILSLEGGAVCFVVAALFSSKEFILADDVNDVCLSGGNS